jgi:N utilization substance protein A
MEVIVDDSQLSLAIGKKGQNVRLAAKLLGWKIDIKSEEEKRQEVESAMAALSAPGAPVSVLMEYGVAEKILERLVEAGVGSIEKLGSMTPEQLEEIQGVGPDMIERIFEAVNAYYGQFEEGQGEGGTEAPAETGAATPSSEASLDELAEMEGLAATAVEVEQVSPEGPAESNVAPGTLYDPESSEERFEPGSVESEEPENPEQFGTMEDAGSHTQNQSEGAGLQGEEPKGNAPRGGE